LGLDVHIRTTIRRDMSSFDWLRIGTDVLEVASQEYWLNGVSNADLPNGSRIRLQHSPPTSSMCLRYLGGRERIKVKTYKDFCLCGD
jgi:hypothetical protein